MRRCEGTLCSRPTTIGAVGGDKDSPPALNRKLQQKPKRGCSGLRMCWKGMLFRPGSARGVSARSWRTRRVCNPGSAQKPCMIRRFVGEVRNSAGIGRVDLWRWIHRHRRCPGRAFVCWSIQG